MLNRTVVRLCLEDHVESQREARLLLVKAADIAPNIKCPCVVVLHATAKMAHHESVVGPLIRFAEKGCLAVSIDSRYHGDRCCGGRSKYNESLVNAWRKNGDSQCKTTKVEQLKDCAYPFIYGKYTTDLLPVDDIG